MSTDISPAALNELEDATVRNFGLFGSAAYTDLAMTVLKVNGHQAAAQLAPGETIEWITPGIVHRHGKLWPGGVLIVTPHRLILFASRGTLRVKHEIDALYRGPESLLETSYRLLPGGSKSLWTLELNSEQGPFLFAVNDFSSAQDLAELTGAFISRRAVFTPQTGRITVDGQPLQLRDDAFAAAQGDLSAVEPDRSDATETVVDAAPILDDLPYAPAVEAPIFEPAPEAPLFEPEPPVVEAPEYEPAATYAPPQLIEPPSSIFAPPAEPELTASIPEPSFFAAAAPEPELSVAPTAASIFAPPVEPEPAPAIPEPSFFTPPTQRAPETSVFASSPEPVPVAGEAEPVATVLAVEPPAADWYDDPLGEAELRYWDGLVWTESVIR